MFVVDLIENKKRGIAKVVRQQFTSLRVSKRCRKMKICFKQDFDTAETKTKCAQKRHKRTPIFYVAKPKEVVQACSVQKRPLQMRASVCAGGGSGQRTSSRVLRTFGCLEKMLHTPMPFYQNKLKYTGKVQKNTALKGQLFNAH